MDEKIKLSRFDNVDATNLDNHQSIGLSVNTEDIIEYDIRNVLNVTAVYEAERQLSNTYRFYGEIEYFSPLNAMITGYTEIEDFFTVFPLSAVTKSILTDFKFYLLAPTTAYTGLITGSTGGTYQKDYEVISELDNFEINNAGYSTNVFGEQQHSWDFNLDFNLQGRYDGLNFPLNNVYLYAQYQPQNNGDGDPETMSGITYDSSGNPSTGTTVVTILNSGDTVIGDVIEWNKFQYTQETLIEQEYYISTPYSGGTERLIWRYSPIIPIEIRVFEDDLQRANISGTSYEEVTSIPEYATNVDNVGNYVWRNLQDKGFVDPLTGDGVSYPFVNKRHYVFNNIIVSVKPNLDDPNTEQVFTEIIFAENTFISSQPTNNLDNVGKLCNI